MCSDTGVPHRGTSHPQCLENGPELVKNDWLVGQKLLVFLVTLQLNFIIFQKFDHILPKFDKIEKVT